MQRGVPAELLSAGAGRVVFVERLVACEKSPVEPGALPNGTGAEPSPTTRRRAHPEAANITPDQHEEVLGHADGHLAPDDGIDPAPALAEGRCATRVEVQPEVRVATANVRVEGMPRPRSSRRSRRRYCRPKSTSHTRFSMSSPVAPASSTLAFNIEDVDERADAASADLEVALKADQRVGLVEDIEEAGMGRRAHPRTVTSPVMPAAHR